jgi:hypothetical protein
MRYSASNRHSLVIGILLAALSAGCLVAFTLLAGSAEYPSGRRVVAADPARVAAPVTISARTDQSLDRDRRTQADNGSSDPSDPIVLGIQVTSPSDRDGGNDRNDRNGGGREDRKDRKERDRDRRGRDGDSDEDGDGPSVARPTTNPPETDDDSHAPNGNAYGHDKKFTAPDLSEGSSSKGGPPAHATAAGHVDNATRSTKSSGPPAHATANGHAKHKKK